ncbi:hypothetical protein CAFE_32170 [Caprobacter fermentans]|uniref:Uncharacterized protein n=1 Tax=Caproicibacter fermentans TaxID=2576756 RepID=A0A6N8I401_9FIRM|nr:hypothetical protein [Caproicibacter fermentans]
MRAVHHGSPVTLFTAFNAFSAQGKSQTVHVLRVLTRFRFQGSELLVNRLVICILLPHGETLFQVIDLAGDGGNFTAQSAIFSIGFFSWTRLVRAESRTPVGA